MYLLAGKDNQTATIRRLACSIDQYTCRAVTKEEWKLPKHVLSAWHWDIFSEATSIPHRLFSPHLYIQYSTQNLTILISYWLQWRARINPWDIAARDRGRAARRKYNINATCSSTGAQTIEVCQEELPECYVTNRKSPVLPTNQKSFPDGTESQSQARKINIIWILNKFQDSQDSSFSQVTDPQEKQL